MYRRTVSYKTYKISYELLVQIVILQSHDVFIISETHEDDLELHTKFRLHIYMYHVSCTVCTYVLCRVVDISDFPNPGLLSQIMESFFFIKG